MMIAAYPKEIENLMKVWRPYGKRIHNGEIENIPQDAIKAYEESKNGLGNKINNR